MSDFFNGWKEDGEPMSDNLIERLRANDMTTQAMAADEAADALEAMQKENEKLADIIETHMGGIEVLQARVAELGATIKRAHELFCNDRHISAAMELEQVLKGDNDES